MRRLRIAVTISSSVKSGCSATNARSHSACASNGDLLPPLGFAFALPVSRQRRHHLTAELGLSLNVSAASRRDAPDSTASITRSRRSSEYGFGIDRAPQSESVPSDSPTHRHLGIPRFKPDGICSNWAFGQGRLSKMPVLSTAAT